ncbi:MAG: hypothetical protein IMF10_06795 [Proteobacteria bacterium]|nr:hypothetical protein [Pseudomonadota bacterium]
MKPVFVVNPSGHPRYKFFKGCGEEIYKTFLNIFLVYHQNVLGGLVVQTVKEDFVDKIVPMVS